MRGGAVVAHEPHKLNHAGSIPAPATRQKWGGQVNRNKPPRPSVERPLQINTYTKVFSTNISKPRGKNIMTYPDPLIARGLSLSQKTQAGFYGTPLQVLRQQGCTLDKWSSYPYLENSSLLRSADK